MQQISAAKALSQAIDRLGEEFRKTLEPHNLPRPIEDLVVTDALQHARASKQNPTHVSFLEAYLQLRDHKTISVFGGSRLEQNIEPHQAIFGPLNKALGRLLQEGGWSVISGGGPGKAMKGLHYCLKKAKVEGQGRNCLAVSVASGLNDEKLHPYADIVIRSPENITDRERMIYALAKAGLYYPGYYGTGAEIGEGFLQNYLVDRGPYAYAPAPMILVSYDMGDGTHFWEPLLKQFQVQAVKAGLSKGGGHDWLKVVILPSPQIIGRMLPGDPGTTSKSRK
jgi:predicted Rossmann-fold nucleotide-binding protein